MENKIKCKFFNLFGWLWFYRGLVGTGLGDITKQKPYYPVRGGGPTLNFRNRLKKPRSLRSTLGTPIVLFFFYTCIRMDIDMGIDMDMDSMPASVSFK